MLCCFSNTTSQGILSGLSLRPLKGPSTAPFAIVAPVLTIVLQQLLSENSRVTTDSPETVTICVEVFNFRTNNPNNSVIFKRNLRRSIHVNFQLLSVYF